MSIPNAAREFQALMQANDAVTDFVSQIRRRDGTAIWISENARAVRDWAGRLVFYEGTVEDVTARIASAERACAARSPKPKKPAAPRPRSSPR